MKEKCMKFSDCIKVIKPKYIYLKLIPDTSIRNYNSTNIAKMIHHMQKKITQRIKWEQRKLICETRVKCSYVIDIYKNEVSFYFIVPEQYVSIAKTKIREVWPRITIEEVEEVKPISDKAIKYELGYKKEDALSLSVDRKNNEPLNHILNVIDIMQDDDRITILYNFIPYNQFGWAADYDKTIVKIKSNLPIDREVFSFKYLAKYTLSLFIDIIDAVLEAVNDFFGNEKKENQLSLVELAVASMNLDKNIDISSRKKRNDIILNTQMSVISDSNDSSRKLNNALSVCQAYKSIEGDNELIYKKNKKNLSIEALNFPGSSNKISISECQNLIQLPGRELLDTYKNIRKVDTLESEVPEELQRGYIKVGKNIYKGKNSIAYMSADKNLANLGLVIMGPQGSGKSEFIANYINDVIKAKEAAIVIDFIDKCQLSETIKKVVPKDKLIELNLDNREEAQAFAFNEADVKCNNLIDRLEVANMQTQLMISFINSINTEAELSSRMRRSLSAAGNVVFIHEGTSLRDIVECINNHRARHKFINMVPKELEWDLQDDINNLLDMDEKDKKTGEVIGTKDSKCDFILDRINLLMEDVKLKRMFNKSGEKNINFAQAMNKGKIILIKIPEYKFPTRFHKNILTTFYISKIWLATQVRGLNTLPTRCHVVVDEIFQAPTSENLLVSILPQARKFLTKFILSCHYLNQISTIKEALKASGASYMLLQGTDERNYREMESDLLPYLLEDLLNLKRYNSLNMIKYEKGYAKFITELPKPI